MVCGCGVRKCFLFASCSMVASGWRTGGGNVVDSARAEFQNKIGFDRSKFAEAGVKVS